MAAAVVLAGCAHKPEEIDYKTAEANYSIKMPTSDEIRRMSTLSISKGIAASRGSGCNS
jgi:hypothetical protein